VDPGPATGWREVPDVLGTGTLWQCPACGKKLVQRRMSHSCGPHTVEAFARGLGPQARAVWERFMEVIEGIGPAETFANQGYAGFMVRTRFAGMYRVLMRGPEDFDDELVGWLREAYDVGAQRT
jgi:hypothetical protein